MNEPIDSGKFVDRVAALVEAARKAGADAADAVAVRGRSPPSRSGSARSRAPRRPKAMIFRCASSSAGGSPASRPIPASILQTLAERAVAMAKVSPEDPFQAWPMPARLAKPIRDLDLFDPTAFRPNELRGGCARGGRGGTCGARASPIPAARRQRRPGRPGAGHLARLSRPLYGSRFCRSVSVIAGEGTGMERDYDTRRASISPTSTPPKRSAARPANGRSSRLNPRKAETGRSTSSSIRASRAVLPAISPAPSTARRLRARRASCAT